MLSKCWALGNEQVPDNTLEYLREEGAATAGVVIKIEQEEKVDTKDGQFRKLRKAKVDVKM